MKKKLFIAIGKIEKPVEFVLKSLLLSGSIIIGSFIVGALGLEPWLTTVIIIASIFINMKLSQKINPDNLQINVVGKDLIVYGRFVEGNIKKSGKNKFISCCILNENLLIKTETKGCEVECTLSDRYFTKDQLKYIEFVLNSIVEEPIKDIHEKGSNVGAKIFYADSTVILRLIGKPSFVLLSTICSIFVIVCSWIAFRIV